MFKFNGSTIASTSLAVAVGGLLSISAVNANGLGFGIGTVYSGASCQAADIFTSSSNRPEMVYSQNGVASSQTAGQVKIVCDMENIHFSGTTIEFTATAQSVGGNSICTIRNPDQLHSTQVFKSLVFSSASPTTKTASFTIAYGSEVGGSLVMDCRLAGPTSRLFNYGVAVDFSI